MSTAIASDNLIPALKRVGDDPMLWRCELPDGETIDAAPYVFPLSGAPVADVAAAIAKARAGEKLETPLATAAGVLMLLAQVLDAGVAAAEEAVERSKRELIGRLNETTQRVEAATAKPNHSAAWQRLASDWRAILAKARDIADATTPGIEPNERDKARTVTAAGAVERCEFHAERSEAFSQMNQADVHIALAEAELANAALCQHVGNYGRIVAVRARVCLFLANVEALAASSPSALASTT
jgi:hypothetical protein